MRKLSKTLLLIFLFLLPWQTRWIFEPRFLNGNFWEYGSSSWYGTEILLWLAIILFAIDRFRKPVLAHIFSKLHWQTHRRIFFITLGFLAFLGLEVLHSLDIGVSYNYFFHLLEGLCLFFILTEMEKKRPLLLAFWSGGVMQALFGAYQFFTQNIIANKWLGLALQAPQLRSSVIESGSERWLRAYGSFGSPNILGGYLAIILIIGLIVYLNSKPWQKIFLTLGQVIILVGLILSFSRGAWLGAIVGVAFIIWGQLSFLPGGIEWSFIFRSHKLFLDFVRNDLVKQLFFYSCIALTLFIILQPLFITRFTVSYRLERQSLSERALQYPEAINIFKNYPLLGVGPGAYTFALAREKPALPGDSYQPVHNAYVLIFSEWGIMGGIVWFAIIAWLLALVKIHNPKFLPVVFTMLVLGVFDHYWWSLYSGIILWWTVFGLSLGEDEFYD